MLGYPYGSDYPAPPGNKPFSILDLTGPAAYDEIVQATPPTGGQLVTARQFGLTRIEAVFAVGSDDGQYAVIPYMNPLADGQPSESIRLMWVTADGGVEVVAATDLSDRKVRLFAIGIN